jgi:hypothetical protein
MALGTWASFGAAADRRWLEPLLRDLVSGDSECMSISEVQTT